MKEFETMSPVDGWIVGWLHGNPEERHTIAPGLSTYELTQREQTPALRVFVGSLIHVAHEAESVRALVRIDGRHPDHCSATARWVEVKLQPLESRR